MSVKGPTLPALLLGDKTSIQPSPRNAPNSPPPPTSGQAGSSEWSLCFPSKSVNQISVDSFYKLTRVAVSYWVLVATRILSATESRRHLCLRGRVVGRTEVGNRLADHLPEHRDRGLSIKCPPPLSHVFEYLMPGWSCRLRRLWSLQKGESHWRNDVTGELGGCFRPPHLLTVSLLSTGENVRSQPLFPLPSLPMVVSSSQCWTPSPGTVSGNKPFFPSLVYVRDFIIAQEKRLLQQRMVFLLLESSPGSPPSFPPFLSGLHLHLICRPVLHLR